MNTIEVCTGEQVVVGKASCRLKYREWKHPIQPSYFPTGSTSFLILPVMMCLHHTHPLCHFPISMYPSHLCCHHIRFFFLLCCHHMNLLLLLLHLHLHLLNPGIDYWAWAQVWFPMCECCCWDIHVSGNFYHSWMAACVVWGACCPWSDMHLGSCSVTITCHAYNILMGIQKTRSDGSIERYKARLVAQGQQTRGRDYNKTCTGFLYDRPYSDCKGCYFILGYICSHFMVIWIKRFICRCWCSLRMSIVFIVLYMVLDRLIVLSFYDTGCWL